MAKYIWNSQKSTETHKKLLFMDLMKLNTEKSIFISPQRYRVEFAHVFFVFYNLNEISLDKVDQRKITEFSSTRAF